MHGESVLGTWLGYVGISHTLVRTMVSTGGTLVSRLNFGRPGFIQLDLIWSDQALQVTTIIAKGG